MVERAYSEAGCIKPKYDPRADGRVQFHGKHGIYLVGGLPSGVDKIGWSAAKTDPIIPIFNPRENASAVSLAVPKWHCTSRIYGSRAIL